MELNLHSQFLFIKINIIKMNTKFSKYFIIVLSLIILIHTSNSVFSQNLLEVKGQLSFKEKSGSVKNGEIKLYEKGNFIKSIEVDRSGKFKIDLDLNKDYIFEFSSEGYVTKKISINTEVPEGFENKTFTPIYFAVELFNQYKGVNTLVFTQPVGIIKFYRQIGDFDYDVNYSSEIRSKIDKAEKELEAAYQEHLQEIKQNELAERQQQIAAQKAAEEAERLRKLEEEKAASEARKKAAEQAKIQEDLEKERIRKQQEEEAKQRYEQEQARKQAELIEKQRIAEQQRKEAEEKAKLKAEEEARQKAALEAKMKAEEEARKAASEEATRIEAERKAQLLAQQQEEAKKRQQEENAKRLAEMSEKQRIAEQQRIEAEERAKKEAEEIARKKEGELARQKAEADSLKKVAEEKAKREAEEYQRQLDAVKAESELRQKAEAAQKALEEEQRLAKLSEEKRLSEQRRKEEEAAKIQAEIQQQAQLQKDIEERKAKALAEKLKKQDQLYNSAQKAAEEFTEVKKDYPKGKTVEEFDKFGMHIIRTIVIDDEVVRIYLKVNHEWGAIFFFKNNQSISEELYKSELERI